MSISNRSIIAFLVLFPLFAFALAFFAAYVSQNIAVPDFLYFEPSDTSSRGVQEFNRGDTPNSDTPNITIKNNQLVFPDEVSVDAYVYSDGEHQEISKKELSQLNIITDKEHPSGVTFEGASSQSRSGGPFFGGYSYSEGVTINKGWKERFIELEVAIDSRRYKPHMDNDERDYIYWLAESYD